MVEFAVACNKSASRDPTINVLLHPIDPLLCSSDPWRIHKNKKSPHAVARKHTQRVSGKSGETGTAPRAAGGLPTVDVVAGVKQINDNDTTKHGCEHVRTSDLQRRGVVAHSNRTESWVCEVCCDETPRVTERTASGTARWSKSSKNVGGDCASQTTSAALSVTDTAGKGRHGRGDGNTDTTSAGAAVSGSRMRPEGTQQRITLDHEKCTQRHERDFEHYALVIARIPDNAAMHRLSTLPPQQSTETHGNRHSQ